ncbi:MAG: hypothetical protein KAW46_00190, partial [candidate division Zixibacteria bacterium]|nr:hypothetical protein [candidate division Zixibacteria bacterium]
MTNGFVKLTILIVTLMVMSLPTAMQIRAQTEAPEYAPAYETEMPPNRGFIPSRMDLRHLATYYSSAKVSADLLPAKWDWRETGKVTSIKNQGSCGSCYAFATVADFESKLL